MIDLEEARKRWLSRRREVRARVFGSGAVVLFLLAVLTVTADALGVVACMAALVMNCAVSIVLSRAASELDEVFKLGPRWQS